MNGARLDVLAAHKGHAAAAEAAVQVRRLALREGGWREGLGEIDREREGRREGGREREGERERERGREGGGVR
jgi:hypothetical protein